MLGAVCHCFPEYWETRRALLASQPSCPPVLEAPHPPPGAEILARGACERHFIWMFLRQGHWSMGIYLLWMVPCFFRPGTADHFERRHSSSHTKNQHPAQALLYPEDRPQRSKTYAATVELFCPHVRELALDSSSYRHRKPHGTCIQLQLTRRLAGVEQDDRGGKTGKLHSAPGAVHGPPQRAFHRRCSRY